jgi:hypothetical protein
LPNLPEIEGGGFGSVVSSVPPVCSGLHAEKGSFFALCQAFLEHVQGPTGVHAVCSVSRSGLCRKLFSLYVLFFPNVSCFVIVLSSRVLRLPLNPAVP